MYLSKCSMSPVHSIRPSSTRQLKLARLLPASSTSVLVSIHIFTAAGPPYSKQEKKCSPNPENLLLYVPLNPVFVLLLRLSPLPSASSLLLLLCLFSLREGVTYKPVGDVFTQPHVPELNKVQHCQLCVWSQSGALVPNPVPALMLHFTVSLFALSSVSGPQTVPHLLFVHLSYSSTFYCAMLMNICLPFIHKTH